MTWLVTNQYLRDIGTRQGDRQTETHRGTDRETDNCWVCRCVCCFGGTDGDGTSTMLLLMATELLLLVVHILSKCDWHCTDVLTE